MELSNIFPTLAFFASFLVHLLQAERLALVSHILHLDTYVAWHVPKNGGFPPWGKEKNPVLIKLGFSMKFTIH